MSYLLLVEQVNGILYGSAVGCFKVAPFAIYLKLAGLNVVQRARQAELNGVLSTLVEREVVLQPNIFEVGAPFEAGFGVRVAKLVLVVGVDEGEVREELAGKGMVPPGGYRVALPQLNEKSSPKPVKSRPK